MSKLSRDIFYRKADFVPELYEIKYAGIDQADLRKFIHEYLGESPALIESDPLPTFHYVYRISFSNNEIYLKIPKYEELKYTLLLECILYQKILSSLDIGVGVLGLDLSCSKYPFPFLLLERAKGKCLREIDIDSPYFGSIIENFGVTVASYHAYKTEFFGYGIIDEDRLNELGVIEGQYKSWGEYLFVNFDAHLKFAYDSKTIQNEEYKRIETYFNNYEKDLSMIDNACLLHGDLGSHNIFIDIDTLKVKAVIDWEDALIGDPIFDIAMFASFYRMHEYLDAFMKGYDYTTEVDREIFSLKFWLYYLRIVLAKNVLRFRLGYDVIGKSLSAPKIKLGLENLRRY